MPLLGLALILGACDPTVEAPTPTLTSLSPDLLPAGSLATFTIRGTNLLPGALLDLGEGTVTPGTDSAAFEVRLGTLELAEVTWIDAGTLTATLDQGLEVGTYPLELRTPVGAVLRLETALEVHDSTGPTVELLSPGPDDPLHPGEEIRIRARGGDDQALAALEMGSCLAGPASGGSCVPASTERRDLPADLTSREETFDLTVPATALEGEVLVIEVHAEDLLGGRATARTRLPVLLPSTMTAISPTEGGEAGGTVVAVTGSSFDSRTIFQVGRAAQPATLVTVQAVIDDPSRALLTMPAGQGTVDLVALRGSAREVLADAFNYRPGPSILALVPAIGRADLDLPVEIQGLRLADAPVEVRLDGTPLHLVELQADRIGVMVTAGAAGPATLEVETAFGVASTSYTRRGAPTLTGLEPDGAPEAGGIEVSILGAGFVGDATTRVILGGRTLQPTGLAADRIRFIAPPGTGTQALQVVSSQHPASAPIAFPFHPPPCVESVIPTDGPVSGGAVLTVTGRGFSATTTASVGGQATSVTYLDENTLELVAPATAVAGPATIAVASPEAGLGVCTADYGRNCTPTFDRMRPAQGPAGEVTRVSLEGSCFLDAASTTVSFGGQAATLISIESDRIVVDVPAQSAGAVTVQVDSLRHDPMSPAGSFIYIVGPVLTGVAPADGPLSGSQAVVVTGAAFSGAATYELDFGGTTVSASFLSATTLSASTPPGVAFGEVDLLLIENSAPISTISGGYRYNPDPTCTTVTPQGGPLEGGDEVTLLGSDFLDEAGLTVRFGALPAALTTYVDANTLRAVVPVGVSVGEVPLTVESGRHDPGAACVWAWGAPRLHLGSPGEGEGVFTGTTLGAVVVATSATDPIDALRVQMIVGAGAPTTSGVAVGGLLDAAEAVEHTVPLGTPVGTTVRFVPEVLLGSGRLIQGQPVDTLVVSEVSPPVLSLEPTDLRLVPGEVSALRVRGRTGEAPALSLSPEDFVWESLGPAVEVSAEGLVRGVLAGTAVVVAWDPVSGQSAATTLTVEDRRTVIAPAGLLLAVGQGTTLSFTDTDAAGTVDLTADVLTLWDSSDPAVLSVDAVGAVLALTPGVTTLSADYAAGTRVAAIEVRVGGAGVGEGVTLPAGEFTASGTLALEGLSLSTGTVLRGSGDTCLRLELGGGGLDLPAGATLTVQSEAGALAEGTGWLPAVGGAGGGGQAAGAGGGGGSESGAGGAGLLPGAPGGAAGADAGSGGGADPGGGGTDTAGIAGAGAGGGGGAFAGVGGRGGAPLGGGPGGAGGAAGNGGATRSGSGGGGGDGSPLPGGPGGGGGAGGGCLEIVGLASGTLNVEGWLLAPGGDGGSVRQGSPGGAGGGGSGGRITLDAAGGPLALGGQVHLAGGDGGQVVAGEDAGGGGGGGGGLLELRGSPIRVDASLRLDSGRGAPSGAGGGDAGNGGPGDVVVMP